MSGHQCSVCDGVGYFGHPHDGNYCKACKGTGSIADVAIASTLPQPAVDLGERAETGFHANPGEPVPCAICTAIVQVHEHDWCEPPEYVLTCLHGDSPEDPPTIMQSGHDRAQVIENWNKFHDGIRSLAADGEASRLHTATVGDGPRVMYVCQDCEELAPESCGNFDPKAVRLTPEGRQLCEICYDEADDRRDWPNWNDAPPVAIIQRHAPVAGIGLTDMDRYTLEKLQRDVASDAIMIPKSIAESGTSAEKMEAMFNTLSRERKEVATIIDRLVGSKKE
jgi:hypothetical protein